VNRSHSSANQSADIGCGRASEVGLGSLTAARLCPPPVDQIQGLSGRRHCTSRLRVRAEHHWLSRARLRLTRRRVTGHVGANQFRRSA